MHPLSTQALTGLTPAESSSGVRHTLEAGATDDAVASWSGLLSPQNPLFWLGLVLGTTAGLIGVSGSARLGRAKVSGSIDKA